MNVRSLCVDLAMSMKEEKAIKPALNAEPDTSVSKVSLSLSFCYIENFVLYSSKTLRDILILIQEQLKNATYCRES